MEFGASRSVSMPRTSASCGKRITFGMSWPIRFRTHDAISSERRLPSYYERSVLSFPARISTSPDGSTSVLMIFSIQDFGLSAIRVDRK